MSALKQLKEVAKDLLANEKVDVVIGFTKGTLPGKCTPYFAKKAEDVDNLVWESGCTVNLANYLLKTEGKVGIVVKGCDSRSLVNLFKENQVARDRVFVLGAPCPTQDSCAACEFPQPVINDIKMEESAEKKEDDFSDVEAFSKLPAEERRAYIYKEVEKCVRCYACRNACPACYCKECFVEEHLPSWVGKTTSTADNMVFHLTRAIHVAGRCVDCGACVRACPMDVDLRILNRKLLKDVQDFYQEKPGTREDSELVLNEFKQDDTENFLIGGGK